MTAASNAVTNAATGKTTEFITTSLFAGGLSYLLGYVWFLLADINTLNAIMMLAGMAWCAIAIVTALIAGAVWIARHVRITII